MKNKRQAKIRDIITDFVVETQEDLMAKLAEYGFSVTQATVSRDIREMKIHKTVYGEGYRYSISESDVTVKDTSRFHKVFKEAVIKVDCACNIVIVKTYPGMGSAVGAAVDAMKPVEMIGSIAGDDTVLVLTGSNENAALLCATLSAV